MESFVIAFSSVLPFIIYLLIGYGSRAAGFADEAFFRKLNSFAFKTFFFMLMLWNFYDRKTGMGNMPKLAAFCLTAEILLIIALFIIVPRLEPANPRRGVIIHALYRSNFVLFATPIAISVFGDAGRDVASGVIAFIVPFYNISAILVLEYFRGGDLHILPLLKNILKNPMIEGIIVGLILNLLKIRLPVCIEKTVSTLANSATPLAMIALGGTLKLTSVRKNIKTLSVMLVLKLTIIPLIAFIISTAFGFRGPERFIILILFAAPTATSTFPMAENMGGDGMLAGEMVTLSTLASILTIFLWVFSLGVLGML